MASEVLICPVFIAMSLWCCAVVWLIIIDLHDLDGVVFVHGLWGAELPDGALHCSLLNPQTALTSTTFYSLKEKLPGTMIFPAGPSNNPCFSRTAFFSPFFFFFFLTCSPVYTLKVSPHCLTRAWLSALAFTLFVRSQISSCCDCGLVFFSSWQEVRSLRWHTSK